MFLLSSADFFKINFKKYFKNTFRVTIGLDPDQDRRFVGWSGFHPFCEGYQQTIKVAAIARTELQTYD